MHSVEESFHESRVPSGSAYMSVVTRLSTVQVVFMNRFLVEFLDYLAGERCQWQHSTALDYIVEVLHCLLACTATAVRMNLLLA